jgi:hypothetical protein
VLHVSSIVHNYSSFTTQNILREFEQHPPHPDHGHHDDEAVEPHHNSAVARSHSSSPPPLPRKAPSPKVTFNTEMPVQPESNKVNVTRKESTRRGIELRDEGRPHNVDLARQDSGKPSSSSKNNNRDPNPKEEDLTRSTSHVSNNFLLTKVLCL